VIKMFHFPAFLQFMLFNELTVSVTVKEGCRDQTKLVVMVTRRK